MAEYLNEDDNDDTSSSLTTEPIPSCFNTREKLTFLEISKDKLSATYVGKGHHTHDVGAVQADVPFPTRATFVYFEIEILSAGATSTVSIGLSDKHFSLCRQPGWEPNSYGYHGAEGNKFSNARAEVFGPRFGGGDVIGCGIRCHQGDLFFTLNGNFLGYAFKNIRGIFYPTVGLHSHGERVRVNFGAEAFRFDLQSLVTNEEHQIAEAIQQQPLEIGPINMIVRNYLVHFGFAETLKDFEISLGMDQSISYHLIDAQDLEFRCQMRSLILEGNIDRALEHLGSRYPELVNETSTLSRSVLFVLRCQKFIELLCSNNVAEALLFAQTRLVPFDKTSEEHLSRVIGLLAYPSEIIHDRTKCPLSHLLDSTQREITSDFVNGAIREYSHHHRDSVLERLLKQLATTRNKVRSLNGGMGEVFRLEDVL